MAVYKIPQPNTPESELKVEYKIVSSPEEKEAIREEVFALLGEYPECFLPGLFEEAAQSDFEASSIIVAKQGEMIIGTLMFNEQSKELNWLATSQHISGIQRIEVAKKLFTQINQIVPRPTEVFLYVNAPTAYVPAETYDGYQEGIPDFGMKFAPARKLYESMQIYTGNEPVIEDYYGKGMHVQKVAWFIK